MLKRLQNIALITGAALVLTGCPKTEPKQAAPPPAQELDLAGAAQQVAADLARQVATGGNKTVAVDPLLDRTSGQQTGASLRAQEAFMVALADAGRNLTVRPLASPTATEQVGLVGTGTVGIVTAPDQYILNVALTDRTSGLVVAQAVARFRQADLDRAPTAFYGDSPSLVKDRSVDGYLKTAETPRGSLADPLYVEQLPTAALMANALAEYNAGRWEQALAGYTAAAARPDGQTLRAFNGLYLANIRLGRNAAAEDAFGKIVTLGLATNNLAVKMLFRTGTTEFLVDRNFSGAYPMWIRQLARAARGSQNCLNISGHTSASGTDAVNDRLSLARATAVRALLVREAPGLDARLTVTGLGSTKNIVGTGADDASDAIDRRVEFEVRPCRGA